MSYNGSGTFVVNSTGQPVVTGTVISSTAFNALTADLATGLSTAITKDGQTTTTVRVPFAQGISSTLVTDATSATTGSIITAGGISTQKALWVGTTSRFVGAAQFDAGITGVGTNITGIQYSNVTSAPKFVGTRITSAFTVTNAVITKVQLNSSRMDVGSYWDGANYYYKPLIAGTYLVSGSVYVSGTTLTGLVASVCKNGTSGSGGTEVCEVNLSGLTTAQYGVSLPSSLVAMNGTTDTLELDVTATGTGTLGAVAVRSTTQMSIMWVSV